MRALLAFIIFTAACTPALIPGTNVEDTGDNRKVLEFLAKYRSAVMERSPDAVVGLCTKDYFEDRGTIDQADDYGIDGLKEKLKKDMALTKEIQLEIIVQQIVRPAGDKGPVNVAFRYNERALIAPPSGEKWLTVTDVNRIVLRPTDEGFLIASGL